MKTPPQPPSDLPHSLLLLPTLYSIHPHIYPSLPQQHLHIQAYMCLYVALNHRRTRLYGLVGVLSCLVLYFWTLIRQNINVNLAAKTVTISSGIFSFRCFMAHFLFWWVSAQWFESALRRGTYSARNSRKPTWGECNYISDGLFPGMSCERKCYHGIGRWGLN